jgi:hypothetical protein
MKSLKIFFLFLITVISMTQPIHAQIEVNYSSADSLRNKGDLTGAIDEYKRLYVKDSLNATNVYNLACALSVDKQNDLAFKYLKIAARLDTSVQALVDPDFLTIREDSDWIMFEQNLISALEHKNNLKIQDKPYAQKLWKMGALDQAYYSDLEIVETHVGRNSSVKWALWDLKERINKQNVAELEDLIRTKGWPLQSAVGKKAANAAFLIIQHSTLEKQKRYLPTIERLCNKKEASWQSYALMYDRIQTDENKPQKYGSQVKYNPATKKYELFPLLDRKMVDVWRKEAGLEPLADYVSYWNIKPEEIK